MKGKIEIVNAVKRLETREETLINFSHCSGATSVSSERSESEFLRNR